MTEQTKKKMSLSRSGSKNPFYGKTKEPWNKGKVGLYKTSDETKKLLSDKLKGRVSPKKGKKDSHETVLKKSGRIPKNKGVLKYSELIPKLKQLLDDGYTYDEIRSEIGIPPSTICRIKKSFS